MRYISAAYIADTRHATGNFQSTVKANTPNIFEQTQPFRLLWPIMVFRLLQSHVCKQLRIRHTFDMTVRFGNLSIPARHLHTITPVRTSDSKFTEPLPRGRTRKSSSVEKTGKPSTPKRIKTCKSLVTTDVTTYQFDYFLKITKLLEDDKRKHSLLVRTMKELLDTMSESRGQLQHIETWFWDLVESDHKRQLLVECAVDGFEKAGIFSLLADGKFTLAQLIKSAPNARKSGGEGVYTRLYLTERGLTWPEEREELSKQRKLLPGQPHSIAEQRESLPKRRETSLYVGSSREMMSKMASHDHFLPKQYCGIHATAHTKALRRYCRVLCDLNNNVYAQQNGRIRLVVQQLLIILLGTYVVDNKTFWKVSAYIEKQWLKREAKTEDINEDHSDTVDESETVDEMFERFRDRSTTTSITLAQLGCKVCGKCGWRPITSRPECNGQFGSRIYSLNQFSPIDTIEN